ncbi:alpha/beta fold hydrolase [Herminiimonas sp. CN]|uniref:alpha/beta fold hydrolase n=1 Tax=Herminiimonas sp. CN TaxID=1349818 RepID=UPI00055891AC|nr:alpha/beta hydrolase [Herminiimonas sp. CN]
MTTTKPLLHFAHANSYPAGTYRVFFQHLQQHYRVQALDMHAHNPKYPIKNGWRALKQELIDDMEVRHTEPVILVGHSLGGMLSLMAAKDRSDLVRCVVLLDSPVVAGWRAFLVRISRSVGRDFKFSPARLSVKRRNVWPDADAAFAYFAAKKIFAIWPPQVLHDYLDSGLVPHPDGVTLRFTREAETAVYRSLPYHLGKIVRPGFPVPVGFVGGADSVECRQIGMGATRHLVGRHYRKIPGSHLFPMESPALAASALHDMIRSLLPAQE